MHPTEFIKEGLNRRQAAAKTSIGHLPIYNQHKLAYIVQRYFLEMHDFFMPYTMLSWLLLLILHMVGIGRARHL